MATRKDERDTGDRPAEAGTGEQPGREEHEIERAAETAHQSVRRAAGDGEHAIHAGSRVAERGLSQATELGRRGGEQMRSLVSASARAYRDFSTFSRGDVDVLMQSGARLARGMQEVGWEMMQYTQNSLRLGLQAANEMMTCRSVEDIVQVQRSFLKDSMDTFLQEGTRLLELSSHVATDAINPLAERGRDQGQTEARP